MAFSFPAIPDDLWAQWQARLFREDSKQDEDNLFGSFAFKQMADEEIGAIPQNWPTPSELQFPDLPEATGRVSEEALNPQPRQAPYDASASLLPATIESSDFNPQVQNAPTEEDPFTPSPRFQSDPGQDTAPTAVGSFLDSANEAMQGVFGQVGKTLGDFVQTAGKVQESRQGQVRQVGGLLDTLVGGPEARKDEARFQEITNTALENGFSSPISPEFTKAFPDLAKELVDVTTRQIITSMNPETPFAKGASLVGKATEGLAPEAGRLAKNIPNPFEVVQGDNPLTEAWFFIKNNLTGETDKFGVKNRESAEQLASQLNAEHNASLASVIPEETFDLPDARSAVDDALREVAPEQSRNLIPERNIPSGYIPYNPKDYYLHAATISDLDKTGIDYSFEGGQSPVWMTEDIPYSRGTGSVEVYGIRKDKLDPSKLDTSVDEYGVSHGYPKYHGTIPPDAVVYLGKTGDNGEWVPPTSVPGGPPNEPPTRPPAPPTGGGPLPPEGGGQSLNQKLVGTATRGAANIAGTATGARIGYGDPEDTSISPKDRVIGTLTGALLGAVGTKAAIGVGGRVLRGAPSTSGMQGSGAENIARTISDLTFKGFTKADAKAEEQVQRFVRRLNAGALDEIPEGAVENPLDTERQVRANIQAIGGDLFQDPEIQQEFVNAAQAHNFFIGIRGGKQSAEVQQDLANAINKTAWDIAREWNPKDHTLPDAPMVRLLASHTVAQDRKISMLTDALNDLRALPDSDPSKLTEIQATQGKISREMDLMINLQAMVAHSGSGTGRALQARQNLFKAIHTNEDAAVSYLYQKFMRNIPPPKPGQKLSDLQAAAIEDANKAINELQQLKDEGATPAQLSNFWSAIEKGKIQRHEVFESIRYNSMLSGPRTVEIALVSNSLQMMQKAPRDIISTGLAAARGEASLRELQHEWAGALHGFHVGTRSAMQILNAGISDIAWTEGQDLTTSLVGRVDPNHWTSRLFGVDRVKGAVALMEIPGRLTQMPDEISRHIVAGAESRRLAARQAFRELNSVGNTYTPQKFADRVADLIENPTADMRNSIKRSAQLETFKGPMGAVGQYAEGIARLNPYIGNFLVPFYRTTYHITSRGVDASPIGLAGTVLDILKGRYGPPLEVIRGRVANPEGIEGMLNPALSRRLYDGVLGTAIPVFYFYSQALQGNISGMGPTDPQKKQMMLAQGWTPYSFKVLNPFDQGKPVWISYANLGPAAIPMALAAASAEAQMYGKAEDQGNFGKYVGDVAKRSMALATEQTYLQSIRAVFDVLEGHSDTAWARSVANFFGSMVPFGATINTIGQAVDTQQRRADPGDIGGTLAGRFPGVTIGGVDLGRNAVPVAQDTLGREIPNSLRGAAAFNPIRASATGGKETVALPILEQYGVDYPSIPSTWGGRELTPDQQRAIQQRMGVNTEKAIASLIRSPTWLSSVTAERKRALLEGALNKARQDAGDSYLKFLPKQPTSSTTLTEQDRRGLFARSRSSLDELPYVPGGR